jgi:hypothetical protein
MTSTPPKIAFIVPYRNRPQHKFFFSNYLTSILSNRTDYEIYFSHQFDERSFNRGATKNIGFLAIKNKYPDDYKNITFVFNDVDTVPFDDIFKYETTDGVVKHFYGFNYALGGIVSIKGSDFEAINGYPNFWGWGMEDNVLQQRCEKNGLKIDRSQFFPIGHPNILQLFDGVTRIINRKDPARAHNDTGKDGLQSIHQLTYHIDLESANPLDNISVITSERLFIINILTFMTGTPVENETFNKYDLREPKRKLMHPDTVGTKNASALVDEWTIIPFYPTTERKKEMIQQYGEQKANEIIQYSYRNSVDPTREVMPPTSTQTQTQTQTSIVQNSQIRPIKNININIQQQLLKIRQYNEAMRQQNLPQRIIPSNINKYSPEYSKIIAAKPKATASANIRLGGVY